MLQRLVLSFNLLFCIYSLEYQLPDGIDEFQVLKNDNKPLISAFLSPKKIKPFYDYFLKNSQDSKVISAFKHVGKNMFLNDNFLGSKNAFLNQIKQPRIIVNQAIPNLIFEDLNNFPVTPSKKKFPSTLNLTSQNEIKTTHSDEWKHVTPANLWSLPYNPFSLNNQMQFTTVSKTLEEKPSTKSQLTSKNSENDNLNEFVFVTPLFDNVATQNNEKIKKNESFSLVTSQPFRKQQNLVENIETNTDKIYEKKKEKNLLLPLHKTSKIKLNNDRCKDFKDDAFLATDSCQRHYIKCFQGKSIVQYCNEIFEVFSNKTGSCVPKALAAECKIRFNDYKKKNTVAILKDENSDLLCDGRGNNKFQHPLNCTRIIQCFGKYKFEYPSCPNNLAFDERTQKCNYADQVEGCLQKENKFALTRSKKIDSEFETEKKNITDFNNSPGCNGRSHGVHIPHYEDCSKFYRCVWNRLVLMECPKGTIFNSKLDVCDYPSKIGDCKTIIKRYIS